ncbi:hypothetical protein BDU57DRAFT_595735 [Ampelomyces quisqualis]|uniref:Serine protease n=1 Tax=Ampelomyces quisqualis TaxID=50730 RepID=A0A6A5QKW8_AMPQU|nr:hypothetical protein BDU57DRAFT_595735 [Ampelomyces quisqualis]
MAGTLGNKNFVIFKAESIDRSYPDEESINTEPTQHIRFKDDGRKPVDPKDLHHGGLYRAVAKLFMGFEHSCEEDVEYTWGMGTGQLTASNSLETSAHCVLYTCPICQELTPAKYIKIYLGYDGMASIGDEDRPDGVEFRCADSFTVLKSHYVKMKSKQKPKLTFDVASIRVANAFIHVDPLRFEATPLSSKKEELGVVGYPGDMAYRSEPGAQMFAHFKKDQSFDLSVSKENMLTYTTSTFGGQSGSPVFRRSRPGVSIGIHQGTPDGATINHACPIAGRYGVYVRSYKSALSLATRHPLKYKQPKTLEVELVRAYSQKSSFDRIPAKPELFASEILSYIQLAMKPIEKLQEELSTCTLIGPSEIQLKDKIAGAKAYLELAKLVAQQRDFPDLVVQPEAQPGADNEESEDSKRTHDTLRVDGTSQISRPRTPTHGGFKRLPRRTKATSAKEPRPRRGSTRGSQSVRRMEYKTRKDVLQESEDEY